MAHITRARQATPAGPGAAPASDQQLPQVEGPDAAAVGGGIEPDSPRAGLDFHGGRGGQVPEENRPAGTSGCAVEHTQVGTGNEPAAVHDLYRVGGYVGQVGGDVGPADPAVPGLEDVPDTGARPLCPLATETVDGDVHVVGVERIHVEPGDVPVGHGTCGGQGELVPAGTVAVADRDAAGEALVVARPAPAGVDPAAGGRDGGGDVPRAQIE